MFNKMKLQLDPTSSKPLHVQAEELLRGADFTGRIPEGEIAAQ